MNITFEYANSNSREYLELLSINKLHKLKTKYPSLKKADFFFKIDNEIKTYKYCGIRLSTPNSRIFASSNNHKFDKAIEETICNLEELLEKNNETNS
ncbi:putative sigma-54 modulation protein [Tenacibaculum adriaticum]|uniref:Putative sigma-54 modulation protein n=1 Tax=Tenacibaculum adriaticum TaxID=413713 RepID=A0A5S5DTP8_9FLAO|nr:30S ribosomal protein S30 [Tenacibaculum adriaticum]TYP99323.1 putative sigma-54 modulation protein [Tenacibaculum adriaticum]